MVEFGSIFHIDAVREPGLINTHEMSDLCVIPNSCVAPHAALWNAPIWTHIPDLLNLGPPAGKDSVEAFLLLLLEDPRMADAVFNRLFSDVLPSPLSQIQNHHSGVKIRCMRRQPQL